MLDKKSLGTSGGSLIHVIFNEHGPPAARAFIGVWQRVVNYWILQRGYSIGIGDTIADAETMTLVETKAKFIFGVLPWYEDDKVIERQLKDDPPQESPVDGLGQAVPGDADPFDTG